MYGYVVNGALHRILMAAFLLQSLRTDREKERATHEEEVHEMLETHSHELQEIGK